MEESEMKSRKVSTNVQDADGANVELSLATMKELWSVDLSALLQTMENAGVVAPETDGDQLVFRIPICPQHRLAILPICILCDELSRA
jgi:hypothetical protein